jgi:hypothetical protein
LNNNPVFENHIHVRRSCDLVLAQWKEEIDQGKVVVGLFLNLKRAFETIDRNLLLRKLEREGLQNNENHWVKSYPTYEFQRKILSAKRYKSGRASRQCVGAFDVYYLHERLWFGNQKLIEMADIQ